MLVLSRTSHESVVIGDEVTLTVEEICSSGDGQRIVAAKVRLGFESPRQIAIYRSELCSRGRPRTSGKGRAPKRAEPRLGKVVGVPDAQVRLRIQAPRMVPVRCNGTPTVGDNSKKELDDGGHASTAVHHITCSKDDRITICHNIAVSALDFQRFIPLDAPTS